MLYLYTLHNLKRIPSKFYRTIEYFAWEAGEVLISIEETTSANVIHEFSTRRINVLEEKFKDKYKTSSKSGENSGKYIY